MESKKLWYLAGPAIFTSLCQYTIGASTQLFAGQLGTIELAAVSVENSVIDAFSYSILVCIITLTNIYILHFYFLSINTHVGFVDVFIAYKLEKIFMFSFYFFERKF